MLSLSTFLSFFNKNFFFSFLFKNLEALGPGPVCPYGKSGPAQTLGRKYAKRRRTDVELVSGDKSWSPMSLNWTVQNVNMSINGESMTSSGVPLSVSGFVESERSQTQNPAAHSSYSVVPLEGLLVQSSFEPKKSKWQHTPSFEEPPVLDASVVIGNIIEPAGEKSISGLGTYTLEKSWTSSMDWTVEELEPSGEEALIDCHFCYESLRHSGNREHACVSAQSTKLYSDNCAVEMLQAVDGDVQNRSLTKRTLHASSLVSFPMTLSRHKEYPILCFFSSL